MFDQILMYSNSKSCRIPLRKDFVQKGCTPEHVYHFLGDLCALFAQSASNNKDTTGMWELSLDIAQF